VLLHSETQGKTQHTSCRNNAPSEYPGGLEFGGKSSRPDVARTERDAHEQNERTDTLAVNNKLQDSDWIAKLWEQVQRKRGTSFDTSELRMLLRVALIYLRENPTRYQNVVSHVVAMTGVRAITFRERWKSFVLSGELSELERRHQPMVRLESWLRTELLVYVQLQIDAGLSCTASLIREMFEEQLAVDVSEDVIRFELHNAGWIYGKAKVVGRDKVCHSKQMLAYATRFADVLIRERQPESEFVIVYSHESYINTNPSNTFTWNPSDDNLVNYRKKQAKERERLSFTPSQSTVC